MLFTLYNILAILLVGKLEVLCREASRKHWFWWNDDVHFDKQKQEGVSKYDFDL